MTYGEIAAPSEPSRLGGTNPRAFGAGLICVLGFGLVYILFPVANYTDAKDALVYAFHIDEGRPSFHPNHLLYEPVVWALHSVSERIWVGLDPLITIRYFSLVCAVPFLVMCYALIWRARPHVGLAVLGTGAVAFSFGLWVFSILPDGYLPPLFFAFASLMVLDPGNGERAGTGVLFFQLNAEGKLWAVTPALQPAEN